MKNNIKLFSFVAFFLFKSLMTLGQGEPCSATLHRVFGDVSSDIPKTLNQLGTSPQFGEVPKHTAAAAYAHLKSVYAKNNHDCRLEMDDLLKALGYTGFKDPAFNASKITPEILPAGKIGWMGAYAKGHKYKWSVLGKDFETFRIVSKEGSCALYIMKKCGNAFYDPSVRDKCAGVTSPTADCPCDVLRSKGVAVSLADCPDCKTQTINISGTGHVESGDVKLSTQQMEVIALYSNGGVNNYLALGTYQVPVRSTYEFTADGKLNYSKTVYVCDRGKGFTPTQNISLPIKLDFNVAKQDITLGDNGKVYLTVNDKQYKALKSVFPSTQGAVTPAGSIASNPAKKSITTTADSGVIGGGSGSNPTCTAQTFNFVGSDVAEGNSAKNSTEPMTLIGYYDKTGKLAKGETARKYLCLGTFQIPVASNYTYNVKGQSSLAKVIEVCDKGNGGLTDPNINLPVTLNSTITKQDVAVGDGGRVYVKLTESQFRDLGKSYSRCCSDGSSNCTNK